ncbi:MAG: ribosomal RNA adenine dimethylase domain-containing protein [Planctomycetota bacterium]|jgi:phospholipid N-methyltransferase|nr:ribosomal RNA adenine dimethylase domain-containing protein [Planctomycetota bacterium]
MANGHTRMFIKQFITKTASTGAILPSSEDLARIMIEFARPGPEAVIAEFGPGTGVVTNRILESLLPGQKFFAIEVNEEFAEALRKRFPDLHIHVGCASSVAACCREEGVERVDCVFSGLPWAIFPDDLQHKILRGMIDVMPKGGIFVTFAYLQGLIMPAGKKFKQNMKQYFTQVENSSVIWKNIPPALIYRCTK